MSSRTYLPSEQLRTYVKRIVISENEQKNTYKVLPDTSIVMGFQYSGTLCHQTDSGLKILNNAGVTGLSDKYKIFTNSDDIGTLLVVFTETGAATFLKCELQELFSQSVSLDDMIIRSKMDIVTEQLQEARNDSERVLVIEQFLTSSLTSLPRVAVVDAAVQLIKQTGGNIRVSSLAKQLYISQSQLEKRFRRMVGASPKKFSSIVRLRSLLDNQNDTSNLTHRGLEAGYYDQAHFIKDFRSMTGETPEAFFNK